MLVAFRILIASSDSCLPWSMLRPLPYIDMIVGFTEAVVAGSCYAVAFLSDVGWGTRRVLRGHPKSGR